MDETKQVKLDEFTEMIPKLKRITDLEIMETEKAGMKREVVPVFK